MKQKGTCSTKIHKQLTYPASVFESSNPCLAENFPDIKMLIFYLFVMYALLFTISKWVVCSESLFPSLSLFLSWYEKVAEEEKRREVKLCKMQLSFLAFIL